MPEHATEPADKFFMVLGMGVPTYRHATIGSASREAERLAREYPGQEFIVLEALAIVKKSDVQWSRLNEVPDDDVPF